MMAMVMIRLVAILTRKRQSERKSQIRCLEKEEQGEINYLRAIPLNVFTLRSTYPSLSNIVARVC